MNKDDLELLERLIDKYSLVEVVDGLETICLDKAEHISHDWQDVGLAKLWMSHGVLLGAITDELKRGSQ
jgi:hypothetical protein